MEETRHVKTPEELHSELREMREEVPAEAQAEMTDATLDLAAEVQARAHAKPEEAEMWGGVDTSDEAVEEVLTRAVVDVIIRDELREKLKSGRKLRVKLGID